MILGAVLAGGQSSRFGSDKAIAEFQGRTLLARAVDTLSGWCEHVVVIGRETAPAPTLPDWPGPGLGPLAGRLRHILFNRKFRSFPSCPTSPTYTPPPSPPSRAVRPTP